MKLEELERQIGFTFPKSFHTIYETGAMKWLEMSKDEVKKNREEYLNDAKAFLMVDCDCELYQFEEIPDAIDTLKEYVQWQEEDEVAGNEQRRSEKKQRRIS